MARAGPSATERVSSERFHAASRSASIPSMITCALPRDELSRREHVTGHVTEHMTGHLTEHMTGQTTEHTTDQMTWQVTERVTD